jgi:MoxR-like ATPase
MSDALKRRCIHLYIDYPDRDLEMRIVRLKIPQIKEDWAQALIALQIEDLSPEVVRDTLNVILKYQADASLVREKLDQIIN